MTCASQTKLKRKAEAKEEERLCNRPAWVLDHNLANLWEEGLEEDIIPEEYRLTSNAAAQVKRLCMWAERQVALLEQERQKQARPPLAPPTLPSPLVPPREFLDSENYENSRCYTYTYICACTCTSSYCDPKW